MQGLNVEEIRKDFPILAKREDGRRLIYLDSAASSLKPVQVVEAVKEFELMEYSNIHRGVYLLSQRATERYEEARVKVSRFINAGTPEEVIFTFGTTDSINMLAYALGFKYLKEGDEILLTIMEHHSNILPWRLVASLRGAKVKYINVTDDGQLDYEDMEEKIGRRTKIVSLTHKSNLTGTLVDIKRIARIVRDFGGLIVVDGAQSVPHIPVDVRDLGIDFLAFSGHKMLGPPGIGVLWAKKDILEDLDPPRLGGGAVSEVSLYGQTFLGLPHKFEAGTPNISGAIGLGAAVEYLEKLGMHNVKGHEEELTRYAIRRLAELGELLEIYGPRDAGVRGGIISFNLKRMNPNIVGTLLDTYGVAVRTGKHCAHLLCERLGIEGAVRASFYIYNTLEEIDLLVEALEDITRNKTNS